MSKSSAAPGPHRLATGQITHATSERNLEKILECGSIRPRGRRKGNWNHTVKSNSDTVYLSCAYAAAFAHNACDDREKDGRWAFISFDVAKLYVGNLIADEDAVEQARRGHDAFGGLSMEERTEIYKKICARRRGQLWEESLKVMGTCGHIGAVPVSAACRITLFDYAKDYSLAMALFDHTPSVMLYQVSGEKLTNESRWLAGLDDEYKISQFDQVMGDLTGSNRFLEAMRNSGHLREVVR